MEHNENYAEKMKEQENPLPMKIFTEPMKWGVVFRVLSFHLIAIYGLTCIHHFKILTILWGFFTYNCAVFGVTAGVHRLWSHRSYKAKLPLRIILMVCYSISGQNSVYHWVRDHRTHHKFIDTDADPHNSKRGFWFSHVGWLFQNRNSNVIDKRAKIDMSDIINDPLLEFQRKHMKYFVILFSFALPTILPIWLWNEYWWYAVLSQIFMRYTFALNAILAVNSFAHMWGYRPYNRNIRACDNLGTTIFALGEGWHNYHHVFPWDYRSSELGGNRLNPTTRILDLFRKIGWVYDVKTTSVELIKNTKNRQGEKNSIAEVPLECQKFV